jgi:hypothetical protein
MEKDDAIARGKTQECLCEKHRIIVGRGFSRETFSAKLMRLYIYRPRKTIFYSVIPSAARNLSAVTQFGRQAALSVPKNAGRKGRYETVMHRRCWFCRSRPFLGRPALLGVQIKLIQYESLFDLSKRKLRRGFFRPDPIQDGNRIHKSRTIRLNFVFYKMPTKRLKPCRKDYFGERLAPVSLNLRAFPLHTQIYKDLSTSRRANNAQ